MNHYETEFTKADILKIIEKDKQRLEPDDLSFFNDIAIDPVRCPMLNHTGDPFFVVARLGNHYICFDDVECLYAVGFVKNNGEHVMESYNAPWLLIALRILRENIQYYGILRRDG